MKSPQERRREEKKGSEEAERSVAMYIPDLLVRFRPRRRCDQMACPGASGSCSRAGTALPLGCSGSGCWAGASRCACSRSFTSSWGSSTCFAPRAPPPAWRRLSTTYAPTAQSRTMATEQPTMIPTRLASRPPPSPSAPRTPTSCPSRCRYFARGSTGPACSTETLHPAAADAPVAAQTCAARPWASRAALRLATACAAEGAGPLVLGTRTEAAGRTVTSATMEPAWRWETRKRSGSTPALGARSRASSSLKARSLFRTRPKSAAIRRTALWT
mmetsp:Transcript_7880/g.21889  ORF Transcript_7880/g.21889 Transcript_7880/m.21889 type:complete len:273 (+) Transcript_7880:183-1001(+)